MLNYNGTNIKNLVKNKTIKFGEFNRKIVYIDGAYNYIVIQTSNNKIEFTFRSSIGRTIEVWNAGNCCFRVIVSNSETTHKVQINNILDKNIFIIGGILSLYCEEHCGITNIDTNNDNCLKELTCCNNNLKYLDIDKNINLEALKCYNNNIRYISVNENNKLKFLQCFNNKLTILKNINNGNLQFLDCNNNDISILDIDKNINLRELMCYNNSLKYLDLGNNKVLGNINCKNNMLYKLTINYVKYSLNVSNNNLDFSNLVSILELIKNGNKLHFCDLRNNTLDFNSQDLQQYIADLLKAAKNNCDHLYY